MDNHRIFVSVNGKKEEFRPISAIPHPIVETDNERVISSELGREMSISFKPDEGMERFVEQMKKELSIVDITDWPANDIKALWFNAPYIQKFVTRKPEHYQSLQMEDGFACVAGDYGTLFGVPLILDRKGKIKAARVEFERKGGNTDGG